jgi:hypothetical protein
MSLLAFLVTFPVNVRTFIITFWPYSTISKEAHSTEDEIKKSIDNNKDVDNNKENGTWRPQPWQ